MSEPTNTPSDAGNNDGTTAPAGDEFKPITSQDDLNRILNDRLARERAKYADYRDVKAKASKLDEIEAANKTEAQKLADAKAAAERERDEARAETVRLRVASAFGISTVPGEKGEPSDAELFLTGTDEVTLTQQAERLAGRVADRKKQGNVAPKEGANNSPAPGGTEREFVRGLFGGE